MLMLLAIEDILSGEDLARAVSDAGKLVFVDGKATAGASATAVKNNSQATGPDADAVIAFVRRALDAHPVFQAAAQVRSFGPMMVSRYEVGQEYGLHVDNAFMGAIRSDLSFTLFLSDPDDYDGGALRLELPAGSQAIRLPAGSLVLYPSASLHCVEAITRGQRLAIVGWIESRVLHTEAREALFDLANVRTSLDAIAGIDPLIKLTLQKAQANLIRLLSQ
jgi:PKHD-type hydroxylase